MNKEENYLYIGSGNSALNIKDKDLSNFTIVCANNAWRLFDKSFFDIWIHSGDFPKYNFPKEKNYCFLQKKTMMLQHMDEFCQLYCSY